MWRVPALRLAQGEDECHGVRIQSSLILSLLTEEADPQRRGDTVTEHHPHAAHRVEDAYARAIGRATYAFALMEWQAIWCCEALDDGYAARMDHTTAGEVGENLEHLARAVVDPHLRDDLVGAADEFRRLVRVRNALAHGKPGHDAEGRCILVNDGRPWTLEGILNAGRQFEACSGRLSALLEKKLGGQVAAAR